MLKCYASKEKMIDIIVAIFFISIPVGLDKPLYGSIVGLVFSSGYCFFAQNIEIYHWFIYPVVGALLGYLFPIAARWFFSGYKGGRGKTKPGVTYIGGFGVGRAGQYFGKWSEGIIPTENEEAGWIKNKAKKRERYIGILIRYLSGPIILLLVYIILGYLNK